jgi:hypothetical protein
MSASVPNPDIPITGTTCTGFLERFNGDALGYHGYYGQHFRMSKDGSWQRPAYYVANAGGDPDTWNAELAGDGEDDGDANIKLIAGGSFGNTQSTIRLQPNQFDPNPKPAMSTPVLLSVYVVPQSGTKNVIVAWENDEATPPQLSYSIEIRSIPGDELVASDAEARPHTRSSIFATAELLPGHYKVTMTVTDIFNKTSAPRDTTFRVGATKRRSCELCHRVQAWVLKFVRRLLNRQSSIA